VVSYSGPCGPPSPSRSHHRGAASRRQSSPRHARTPRTGTLLGSGEAGALRGGTPVGRQLPRRGCCLAGTGPRSGRPRRRRSGRHPTSSRRCGVQGCCPTSKRRGGGRRQQRRGEAGTVSSWPATLGRALRNASRKRGTSFGRSSTSGSMDSVPLPTGHVGRREDESHKDAHAEDECVRPHLPQLPDDGRKRGSDHQRAPPARISPCRGNVALVTQHDIRSPWAS
jgi:hypothetical protein